MTTEHRLVASRLAVLTIGASVMLGLEGGAAQEIRTPLADNHMHIQTPALSAL